jgi:hypothetical protein
MLFGRGERTLTINQLSRADGMSANDFSFIERHFCLFRYSECDKVQFPFMTEKLTYAESQFIITSPRPTS